MTKSERIVLIIAVCFLLFMSVMVWANGSTQDVANCTNVSATTHEAVIQNKVISPQNTTAKLCDILTITNTDDVSRIIAFGQHKAHIVYDGKEETLLTKDQSMSVTLNKKGTYIFHDHDDENVKGTFTVN